MTETIRRLQACLIFPNARSMPNTSSQKMAAGRGL